ncbi:helix-turn-helix domain-containing protein [Actinomadura algeriensis]|uniref:AraC-like DNA-binding protein n=1 Tax=Actinomadura algeriensis TaxID=1679523 RepID=A0ABR9K3Q8_9ACTN|nr:helix-turn-helix domain-containing protein [Actinomadura algeriensis]MBE1537239.1 AraC-like DNA-binding protein [Actinomadura algeriensis]
MRPGGHFRDDPVHCEEFGYGLGDPDGIFVLKYRSASALLLGETRQDFLHQLYWSPDGVLAVLNGSSTEFLGPREGYWAARATAHEVRAGDRQTVYRVCLREIPPALHDRRCGPVALTAEASDLIRRITRRDCDEATALAARRRIMTGLTPLTGDDAPRPAVGGGYALTVARALSHDPADPTPLSEWARRLRVSAKTLQRDFVREFGMPYTRWRTRHRLSAARVLLHAHPVTEVAHRVGYASPSAFIAAYAGRYGRTPGRDRG